MKAKGHYVTGFERGEMLDGVWSNDKFVGRVTGQTLSSSSIANSMFSDFPMKSGSMPGYPTHFSEGDFRTYIKEYTTKFELAPLFKTSAEVTSAKRVNQKWEITCCLTNNGGGRGVTTTEVFDHVSVCTGLNQEIRAIEVGSGLAELNERVQHTSNANDSSVYKGKTVVVVGLGESSTDTAAAIANVANHVHVIVRSPTLLLPRNTFGTDIAPDHKLTRALLHCPQYLRTMKLMSQTIFFGPFYWLAQNVGGLGQEFGVTHDESNPYFDDNWSWDWWVLFHKLSMFHPKAKGFGLTRGHVTKTAPLIKQYRQGKVTFHTADIEMTTTNGKNKLDISLDNGSSIENVDEVVNATGYTSTFPFLEGDLKCHRIQKRYRLVYHPDLPDMSFIGFARGGVGSIFFGAEMQARWAALVASGERRLPDNMAELAHEHAIQQAGKWPTKISMVYANAIARNEIGCEPNLRDIFLASPKAWFYLMFGPFCASMYRFRGPGAEPELAMRVFEAAPGLVYPLEFPLQQFLELMFGFLARFWTSIPPFAGDLKEKVTVLRQCVTPFIDLNN